MIEIGYINDKNDIQMMAQTMIQKQEIYNANIIVNKNNKKTLKVQYHHGRHLSCYPNIRIVYFSSITSNLIYEMNIK